MAEKRKLFEEVAAGETAQPLVRPGVIDQGRGAGRGAIRICGPLAKI